MLYDYPDTAKFLNATEKKFVIARLREDEVGLSHEYKNRFIWDAFLSWKNWVMALIFHLILTPVYSFSLFSP
jgi:hypothetical protein